MSEQPFALIGVNSDDLARAHKAIKENGLNWRSFQNEPEGTDQKISADWRVRGWPTIVVLDENFQIHYRGHDGNKATDVAKALVSRMKQADG